MGTKNYLIEGVSGTGKTSVCDELRRRGYHSINGDTEFAYQGDPKTGQPLEGFTHEHNIWNVEKVGAMAADKSHAVSFFCGGSRNFSSFIDLFDLVFVLEVDLDTLTRRLADRPETEWAEDLLNGNSFCDCMQRKRMSRRVGLESTRPRRSIVSWMRS